MPVINWLRQSSPMPKMRNGSEVQTEWQARDTAELVKEWWHLRGYPNVMVWPEIIARSDDHRCMWGVRSNLRQGLPPGVSPRDVVGLYRGKWGGK